MSNNRRVLITGGTRGIGRGLVIAFARQGYQVAFTYRHQARLAAELEAELGTCVKGFALDQSDSAAIAPSVQAMAEATGGGFDILINNAAIAQEKPFMSITASDWSAMLNCNLQGPFLLAQACLPHMINQGWGRIINISSIGGQWGGFNQVHYAASKAGLISLTRSIAKIYSKNGIASIAIAIGLVETDMTAKELSSSSGIEKVKAIPAGRLATFDEISAQVIHLCADESFYMTGQTLNINGGMYFG